MQLAEVENARTRTQKHSDKIIELQTEIIALKQEQINMQNIQQKEYKTNRDTLD